MKHILTILCVIFFSLLSFTQQLPNLPKPIGAANAEVWNNSIYLFGGSDDFNGTNVYPEIYKFDGTNWAYHDAIPDNDVWDVETVLAGDFVSLFGGWDGSGSLNRKYNLNTGVWAYYAPSPNTLQNYGLTAEVLNGIIYLFNSAGDVYAYNISTDVWTTKTSCPIATNWNLNSILYQNDIYIVGWDNLNFYKYTPATDQWTPLANVLYPVDACGIGIVNNLIYCIGGNSNGGSAAEYKSIIIYDITAGSWSTSALEISSKRHWMATAHYKGGLYVIGGLDELEMAVNTVEQIVPQGTSDIDDEVGIPEGYYLSQNYPNPFNPSTKINYSIPEITFVTLKVFDVLGNEIAALVNEEKPAGTYQINYSSDKLPSGIYFYRLEAGSFIETKKMVLLR
jgi:N-acetylneuraminic acid mutarotase